MKATILTLSIICGLYTQSIGNSSWKTVASGTFAHLLSIDFSSDSIGHVVGTAGVVLRTTGIGHNWNTVFTHDATLNAVYFPTAEQGYAMGDAKFVGFQAKAKLVYTSDSGNMWSSGYELNSFNVKNISFPTIDTGYLIGEGTGGAACNTAPCPLQIKQSTDGGQTWTNKNVLVGIDSTSGSAIWFVNSRIGYAVGRSGAIARTNDYGNTWTEIHAHDTLVSHNRQTIYNDVFFIDSLNGYVIGSEKDKGVILKTIDGGNSWSVSRTNQKLNAIQLIDSTTGYVVGDSGFIAQTLDGGISWTEATTGSIIKLNDIYMHDTSSGVIIGNDGLILILTKDTITNIGFNITSGDTFCIGYTIFLENTSNGFDSYQWLVNDSSISNVSDTLSFTFNSTGTFEIDLIGTIGGIVDTASRSVTIIPKPASSFIASDTSVLIGDTVFFTNTSTNADAYFWRTLMQNFSYAIDTSYVYMAAGSFKMNLFAQHRNCSYTSNSSMTITVDSNDTDTPNNITHLLKSSSINIFPNPAKQTIYFNSNDHSLQSYAILNQYGQIVKTAIPITQATTQIDLSDLPKGLYYLKVTKKSEQNLIQYFISQ